MDRVAVFIDAGYFWVQLCKTLTGSYISRTHVSVDYDKLRVLVLAEVKKQFGLDSKLLRVYWYDGPGLSGKTAEHSAIDRLDDFKLRLGTRNTVGNQKGVDGLIIADLISLTQQKSISDALLMSGDGDITPGVVAAQSMGLRVHLLSLGTNASTSPYLAAEADYKGEWTNAEAAQFAVMAPAIPPTVAGTASTVVAGPLTAADMTTIVTNAIANINASPDASLLATYSAAKTPSIPPVLDRYLMAAAWAQLGRQLTSSEGPILRSEFKRTV